MDFSELGLIEPIVRAVTDQGYSTPTPIQAQSIPVALEGRDILGCAQTGTGKTCAFALPILHRLMESTNPDRRPSKNGRRGRAPRALVLAPTRELASQIFDSFGEYGRNLPLRGAVVFGGVSQFRQVKALQGGIDVLVATPGRLHDLINQGYIDLREIETLVLDEADRMLDMGFIHDIKKVIKMVPENRQTLFFSATVSREIRELTGTILNNPVVIETAPEATAVESIAQRVYLVNRDKKSELLERLLGSDDVGRALVFSKTKHGADKLTKVLRRANIKAESIHGNKSQNARTRAMDGFKAGRTRVLVATDIAARGIDVDGITHVFNYDMPIDPETYVHRIGRTARAGASGIALSFCDHSELGLLRSVERRARIKIDLGQDHDDLTYRAPTTSHRDRPSTHKARKKSSGSRKNPSRNPRGASGASSDGSSEFAPGDRARPGKPGGKSRRPSRNSSGSSETRESGTGGRPTGKKTSKRGGKPDGGWGSPKSSGRGGKPKIGGRNASKPGAGKPGAGAGKKKSSVSGRSKPSPTR